MKRADYNGNFLQQTDNLQRYTILFVAMALVNNNHSCPGSSHCCGAGLGVRTRLPPMYPWFHSQTWHQGLFSRYSGFPFTSEINISKFQSDLESKNNWVYQLWGSSSVTLVKQSQYVYGFIHVIIYYRWTWFLSNLKALKKVTRQMKVFLLLQILDSCKYAVITMKYYRESLSPQYLAFQCIWQKDKFVIFWSITVKTLFLNWKWKEKTEITLNT